MKTLNQLKSEIYSAITGDATIAGHIGTRLYWIGKISGKSKFPLITYKAFDDIGLYAFDDYEGSNVVFQIDTYTSPSDVATMDGIIERLKTVMHAINYRLINSPIEFHDKDIDKIIRPTRWEKYNV